MRRVRATVALVIAAGVSAGLGGLPAGRAAAAPFPDVPPWHWAYEAITKDQAAGLVIGYPAAPTELIQNSLVQILEGFVHAQARGAREWVERFTYNRPADWPGPLERARLAGFSLAKADITVTGATATAAVDATVDVRQAGGVRAVHTPMRVRFRLSGGDWQADYATLAVGSPVFR